MDTSFTDFDDKRVRRREREKAKRLSETDEEREVRLQKRREAYRRRRDSETQEQAERRRLSRKNSDRSKGTPEQRAERL